MSRIAGLLLLLAALPASAAQATPASVEDLARSSDAVVRGRVAGVRSRWVGKRIFTFAEIERSSLWRGRAPARVRVVTPGGVVDGIGQRVDGAAVFAQGEDVVLFLSRAEAGSFRVRGLAQGKFTVVGDVARPDLEGTRLVGSRVRAGERRSEEMPVSELEGRVRAAR